MKIVLKITKIRFLLILLLNVNGLFYAQTYTSFNTVPLAVNNVINICAGSTILFKNTTSNFISLQAPVTYNWNFGNGITKNTSGPHAIAYPLQGTYTVSLNMNSGGVNIPSNPSSLTIIVGPPPASLPSVVPTNTCTNDTIINGVLIFQTSSGNSSCTCQNQQQGPALGFQNTNNLGSGTTIDIYWGGNGTSANGGANLFTSIQSSQLLGNLGTLSSFSGQISNPQNGHYSGAAGTGSYHLIYVINFSSGCNFSGYINMSWGSGIIDFSPNSSSTVCSPFDYELAFDNQFPGNTYLIDWGDGSDTLISYPNLPIYPNNLPHDFAPSCNPSTGQAIPYM